jgi:hypothetical protein
VPCKPNIDDILEQDPQADLDYGFDWSDWLAGDTVTTSAWIANKSGLTVHDSTHDSTSTTAWLSGGTLGEGYTVTNHIVTAGGRANDRSFRVVIKNQ